MPTFYEGEPIAVVHQTLTAEEYAQAAVFAESHRSVWSRRGVRAAAALTVAALAFSCIPVYRYQYATAWIPIAVGCLGVLLAAYFFWFQPVRMQKRAAAVFQKNRFWQQRCKIAFYRDSVCCETPYEKISGYWSDYYACYECPAYLVVAGGWDRHLLIVDKKQLSPGQREAVSAHMREQFANRYLWAQQ